MYKIISRQLSLEFFKASGTNFVHFCPKISRFTRINKQNGDNWTVLSRETSWTFARTRQSHKIPTVFLNIYSQWATTETSQNTHFFFHFIVNFWCEVLKFTRESGRAMGYCLTFICAEIIYKSNCGLNKAFFQVSFHFYWKSQWSVY